MNSPLSLRCPRGQRPVSAVSASCWTQEHGRGLLVVFLAEQREDFVELSRSGARFGLGFWFRIPVPLLRGAAESLAPSSPSPPRPPRGSLRSGLGQVWRRCGRLYARLRAAEHARISVQTRQVHLGLEPGPKHGDENGVL